MVDIVADVSGAESNSYLTLDAADLLMDGFPNAEKWSNLNDARKGRFLLAATRLVDRFKSWPPKQDADQALAFPTSKDSQAAIPKPVINAVCETLDYFASGRMVSLKKLQAEGVRSSSVLGQNATFDPDMSELPAGARNELEKLWRAHNAPVSANPQKGFIFGGNCPEIK